MSTFSIIAGADVGGTKIAVSLADRDGIRARASAPVQLDGLATAIPDQIIALLDQLATEANIDATRIAALGVASSGPFVIRAGTLEVVSPNLCGGMHHNPLGLANAWASIPLQARLAQRFDTVVIENDGVAALQAERKLGALRGIDDCIYGTWSTGLGFGLCVDGHVLHGKNGNAGHAGHTFVDANGSQACGCGNVGDAESQYAGNALSRLWRRPASEVFADAHRGAPGALTLVTEAAHGYAGLLYNLVVTLDTRCIALGGSVFFHNRDLLLPLIRAGLTAAPRRAGLPGLLDGVDIRASALGERVADYGALCLVLPDEWLARWQSITTASS